jgi:hypothetical protein
MGEIRGGDDDGFHVVASYYFTVIGGAVLDAGLRFGTLEGLGVRVTQGHNLGVWAEGEAG